MLCFTFFLSASSLCLSNTAQWNNTFTKFFRLRSAPGLSILLNPWLCAENNIPFPLPVHYLLHLEYKHVKENNYESFAAIVQRERSIIITVCVPFPSPLFPAAKPQHMMLLWEVRPVFNFNKPTRGLRAGRTKSRNYSTNISGQQRRCLDHRNWVDGFWSFLNKSSQTGRFKCAQVPHDGKFYLPVFPNNNIYPMLKQTILETLPRWFTELPTAEYLNLLCSERLPVGQIPRKWNTAQNQSFKDVCLCSDGWHYPALWHQVLAIQSIANMISPHKLNSHFFKHTWVQWHKVNRSIVFR